MEGFDLSNSAIVALDKLIDLHSEMKRWRGTVTSFISDLESNADRANQKQINDPTVLNPKLPEIQDLLSGYGDAAINALTVELQQWHAKHKWKM